MEQQLELLLKLAPVTQQPKDSRRLRDDARFQARLSELRKDRSELEAIGHQLYSDFVNMLNCPLDRYKLICSHWHESKGHKVAEIVTRIMPFIPQKPIRQWSTLAKQRNRLVKLHKRMHKKYSFPEYFHRAIQEQLLTNPDYYGVCPLPSELACKYFPPNLRQMAAIEKENNRRLGGR
jgi:hypothetical protein